jgi:hypothetical protein
MMKLNDKSRAPRKVRARIIQAAGRLPERPFLFPASPEALSIRDALPFAVHPRQHELEKVYRDLKRHFKRYAEVYARKDEPVRPGTKKAELRNWVISTGNGISHAGLSAFCAAMEPLDISRHWSTSPIEEDLIRPDKVLLEALATGKVRRIQAIIPVLDGSVAKSLQEAVYEGDHISLIRRILGRPLLYEEEIALSAAKQRAKVQVGEGLQEAICLLAATGLLQGAGVLWASHRKDNFRISFGDALITSESIGLADMVRALVRLEGGDEDAWVCTPDSDLFGQGPSIFIQAVGFSEDPHGSDVVAAPWMSRFPDLFGPNPAAEEDGSKPQEAGRRLSRLRASFQGHLVLEGLDFGSRRILMEVHDAMMRERESGFRDIQSRLSERRQDSLETYGSRFYRDPPGPHYAGRPLLPWEDPGQTDVSFPELRYPSDSSVLDVYHARKTRKMFPWGATDPLV